MSSAKRLCDEKTNDRISELPTNILDNIFDRMSIRDTAKTSILSTKWRYIWASYPKLVFDENFFKEINRKHNSLLIGYAFPKVINEALLVHIGPILKFMLYIPNVSNDLSSAINQWVLFLSRNGIKELELRNSNPTSYILPSCIFSCSSLIDLKVNNCIMKLPLAFGGFHYLVKLYMEQVSFSTDMSAPQRYNFPVLECLTMWYCTGIEHKSILAPKLHYLSMVECGQVNWKWFESNKQLTVVHIQLVMENVEQTVNMNKFLGDIPEVWTLWLDGFSLKYLATEPSNPYKVLEQQYPCLIDSLPLAASLKHIRLHNFGVDDHDQISSALCLLKNCPNLVNLKLIFAASTNNVTEYLEPSNCIDVSLDKLQMVKIEYMRGLKAELLFIKLILARSTHLLRMVIEHGAAVGASNCYTISRELLRFPRASSRAEIIIVDPVAAT